MSYATGIPVTIEAVESDSSAARMKVKVEPNVKPTAIPETRVLGGAAYEDDEIECDEDVEQDCAVSVKPRNVVQPSMPYSKGEIPSSIDVSEGNLGQHLADRSQDDNMHLMETSVEAANTVSAVSEQRLVDHILNFEDGIAQCLQGYAITGNVEYFISKLRNFIPIQDENGDSTIHLAVIYNQTQALKTLLHITSKTEIESSINQLNIMHQTALTVAVLMKNIEMAEILLKHGANPFVKDDQGNGCMHSAAQLKSLKLMSLLCNWVKSTNRKRDALNDCNYAGYSPLHIAVENDIWPCAKQLLLAGADVNVGDRLSGKTVLHHAVSCRNHAMVRNLIMQSDIDVNAQSFDGRTALHLAVSAEDETSVRLIMSSDDADINVEDCYLLSDCEEEDEMDEDIFIGHTPYYLSKPNRKIQSLLETPYPRMVMASLDAPTLESVSKRLNGGDWKRLAEQLDLQPLISSLSSPETQNPSQKLIQYYLQNAGTISLLVDSLIRMGCHDSATIIKNSVGYRSMEIRVAQVQDGESAMDQCDSDIGHNIQSY